MCHFKKLKVLFALAVVLSSVSSAEKPPLTTNGVNWGTNYYNPDVQVGDPYDGLPTDATPKWTRGGAMVGGTTLTDSYLRITTAVGKSEFYSTKSNWDLSGDATVEATLRVIDQAGASGAGSIRFGNSDFYGTILFSANKIGTVAHDLTAWTTVRIVFEGMSSTNTATAKVYVNNNPKALFTSKRWTAGSTLNQLTFGDPNSTSTDGTMDWESIRWTCSGAFAPAGL